MLELFKEYVANRQFSEALLVGQNLFNKNSDDVEVFEAYFNLVLSLGNGLSQNTETERLQYLQQATLLLTFFSENVEISREMVSKIQNFQGLLFEAEEKLDFDRDVLLKKQMVVAESENGEILAMVQKLLKEIEHCTSTEQLEKYAGQVASLDQKLNHELLSENQSAAYELLSQKCTSVLEEKIKFFEKQKNKRYNLKAVEAYERVFRVFKTGAITDDGWMKEFFQYDPSLLYNETLVYYNHVFSYILNQLDEDGKFLMTQCAIQVDRKGS